MGESIIISSGKGGVGKTNVAVNLGVALAEMGKNVAIVDASLTTPDVSLHLGVPFHVKSLAHVLKGGSDIERAMFAHKSGAKVIPGNIHVNVLRDFEGNKFSRLLGHLKKEHDYVLVDCAAGLGREAVSAIRNCDKMLVVAIPELPSAVNSSKALQVCREFDVEPVGVVLNRVGRHKHELAEKDMVPLLNNVPIIARIPEDENVSRSIRRSEAVVSCYPRSNASKEFRNMAFFLSEGKMMENAAKTDAVKKLNKKKINIRKVHPRKKIMKKGRAGNGAGPRKPGRARNVGRASKAARAGKARPIRYGKSRGGEEAANESESFEIDKSIPVYNNRQKILHRLKELNSE
jgi:septum site-determining protein MinD